MLNDGKDTSNSPLEQPRGKKTFWNKFMTFLAMGGIILILIVAVAIVVGISMLLQ